MKYLVFIDVAGYTKSMSTRFSDTTEILKIYDSIIEKEVNALDGDICSKAGDGYYIQFSADKNTVDVVSVLKNIINSCQRIKDALAIRIGFHLGSVEKETERNIDINLCQRLEGASYQNQITMSENIYKLSKDEIAGENIIEDEVELKGLGKQKVYRIKVLPDESQDSQKYQKPQINMPPILIEHDKYILKIVEDSDNEGLMFEQKHESGSTFYAELKKGGDVVSKINNLAEFKIVPPPDDDIIEKVERIENGTLVTEIKYKWGALYKSRKDAVGNLIGLTVTKLKINISPQNKTITLTYNFEGELQKISLKKKD